MYAFKTERPDAARRYHNKFVTGTNYQEESNRRFALSEPTENILRTSILESGWLIKNITLRDVGNDSNLLIVFYVQIMPDDLVMQLHRF